MADDWLGISSTELDSDSGDNGLNTIEEALNGTDHWGSADYGKPQWFIIDLGQTYTITKVRGRSSMGRDPIDVDIYVSDSKTVWGDAVATGISNWQDTTDWVEADTTDKDGRYIKVAVNDWENSGFLKMDWGGTSTFTIFDAYGDVAAAGQDFYETLSDTLSVSDDLVSTATYKRATGDSLSVGDGLKKEARIPIEELLSIADTLKKSFGASFLDTLSISDLLSVMKLYKITPSDTLSISDLLASTAAYKRTPADNLSISDLLGILRKKDLNDQVDITDGLASFASYKRALDDSFSISDALKRKQKISLDDTLSIDDGIIKSVTLPLADLLSIADSLKKTFKLSILDTFSISDLVSTGAIQRSLSDTLTITDLLKLKLKISRGEQLSISDQVIVARCFYLNDTLSISDSLTHKFILAGGLTDLTQSPALVVTRCFAIADDVPKTEKLRVWARAKDGKEKIIYIDPT